MTRLTMIDNDFYGPQTFSGNDSNNTSSEHSVLPPVTANVSIAISKPLDDSDDTATDVEDLSIDGCLDEVSLNDDDNPKAYPCCAICLEKFRNGDEVSYSHDPLCSHEFHTKCIVEWLLKRVNCPYCRRCYVPMPPSVKKASISISSSEPNRDEAAIPVLSTSNVLSLLRVEPIDVEIGEGASTSVEALPQNSIMGSDERISI